MLSNVCAIFVPWISLWTMNLYFKGDTQRWLIYRHSPTVSPSLSHTRTHTSNGPLRAASTNHFNTNFCSCRPFGSRFLKVQSNELITSAMWPKINHNFTGLHSKLTSITPRQPPCHLSTTFQPRCRPHFCCCWPECTPGDWTCALQWATDRARLSGGASWAELSRAELSWLGNMVILALISLGSTWQQQQQQQE